MVFSSVTFLFWFLPALIILYYLAPAKLKNLVMIIGSFVFYAWGEIRFLPVMFALSVEDFICARLMQKYKDNPCRRKLLMFISVGSNLAVLIFFKYTTFLVGNVFSMLGVELPPPNIILPIGVSFNTFQSISYALDVYRGETDCEKSFYSYLTYTTLFPQIIAGPIVRYVTVENDLDDHLLTRDGFARGMRRFIVGLAKKVLIANNVGLLWSRVSVGEAGEMSVALYWIGIISYTFQIYFDFSGYSDMAIGLARIFGLTFDENFNFPYISQSITEFWRRWHITLGAWFRDYVYIPLGGNRCSKIKNLRNIVIVWALTGLWHGASWNFMLWGLYFAALLLIEKTFLSEWLKKFPPAVRHIYAMLLVTIGWVIFYFEDLGAGTAYIGGMFGFSGAPLFNSTAFYYLMNYGVVLLAAVYFSTPHFKRVIDRAENASTAAGIVGATTAYIGVFVICVAYLVNSSYNPFLYFRF
ncbi:MAG: MBOAT family O-acyltransferase [Oscillospiraceae bacterium]